MPTSPHFNFYTVNSEQDLVSNLVAETIRIYGHDVFYLPRSTTNVDKILREDRAVEYNSNYPIEMYVKSTMGFEGDLQFLSRFSTEIRQQLTLSVAIQTFDALVGTPTGLERPREGDLIFFPLDTKIMVIKDVNKYSMFYQVGSLSMYDLVCEVFEYSNEKMATGIPLVDRIESALSLSTAEWGTLDINDDPVLDANGLPAFGTGFADAVDSNDTVQNRDLSTEGAGLIDFSVNNPFSENF